MEYGLPVLFQNHEVLQKIVSSYTNSAMEIVAPLHIPYQEDVEFENFVSELIVI